ncbi:hypothetical protein [Desulfosporosinus sp. BG]|uniref:hypothetical protein n=1 Tax=Desulfosporosinus sp. BG TaxID=1633135 RepID=UPI00083BA2C2|nr:hypothetical protein [Desulfosporosinus sp. BG]ODA38878.1 hypothetical protein DSBG_4358 [Desulfosporosinus sp. BG]
MVIVNDILLEKHLWSSINYKGENNMSDKLTVDQMEQELRLDKIQPVTLTPSEEKVMIEEEDYFQDFYEEELRAIYGRSK